MAKIYQSDIHLLLSHILNKNPDIIESQIFHKTSRIKSRKTVKDTLIFMEEQQIILNPHLFIRNCNGYTNYYMIVKVRNWEELYERIICKNYEIIDAALYMRSWKKNRFAFIKYHNALESEVEDILEQGSIDYFHALHPQSITDQELPKKLESEPTQKSCILPEKLDKEFDWDYDTKQVFWWLSINYRLSLTHIARQLEISRTTVRRKKRLIEEFTYIHYPTYIFSLPNYTGILSSFHTEYPEFLEEIFQNLSATSYLFGNQKRTFCFINTTRPGHVIGALEAFEKRTIVEDMDIEIAVRNWNRIQDEFVLGRIPERFFWMFKKKK